jgi:hypothetical protein
MQAVNRGIKLAKEQEYPGTARPLLRTPQTREKEPVMPLGYVVYLDNQELIAAFSRQSDALTIANKYKGARVFKCKLNPVELADETEIYVNRKDTKR